MLVSAALGKWPKRQPRRRLRRFRNIRQVAAASICPVEVPSAGAYSFAAEYVVFDTDKRGRHGWNPVNPLIALYTQHAITKGYLNTTWMRKTVNQTIIAIYCSGRLRGNEGYAPSLYVYTVYGLSSIFTARRHAIAQYTRWLFVLGLYLVLVVFGGWSCVFCPQNTFS